MKSEKLRQLSQDHSTKFVTEHKRHKVSQRLILFRLFFPFLLLYFNLLPSLVDHLTHLLPALGKVDILEEKRAANSLINPVSGWL